MKRMFTKLEIMALAMLALAPTVEGLETSIASAGFNGEIPLSSGEGGFFIDDEDIPDESGVYKLDDDGTTLGVIQIDIDNSAWAAVLNGNFYQGAIEDSTDISFNDSSRSGTKPIYFHPVRISFYNAEETNIGTANVSILNNNKNAFGKAAFLATIKELMDNGALIAVNGYIKGGDNKNYNLYQLVKVGDNAYRFYGNSETAESSFLLGNEESRLTIYDGVNRIN